MLSQSNSACSSRTPNSAIRTNSTPFVAVSRMLLSRGHSLWPGDVCPRPPLASYAWRAAASIPAPGNKAVERPLLRWATSAAPDCASARRRIARRETAASASRRCGKLAQSERGVRLGISGGSRRPAGRPRRGSDRSPTSWMTTSHRRRSAETRRADLRRRPRSRGAHPRTRAGSSRKNELRHRASKAASPRSVRAGPLVARCVRTPAACRWLRRREFPDGNDGGRAGVRQSHETYRRTPMGRTTPRPSRRPGRSRSAHNTIRARRPAQDTRGCRQPVEQLHLAVREPPPRLRREGPGAFEGVWGRAGRHVCRLDCVTRSLRRAAEAG